MTKQQPDGAMVKSVVNLIDAHRDQLQLPVQTVLAGVLTGVFEALAGVYGKEEVRSAFLSLASGEELDPKLHELDLRQADAAGRA